VNVDSEASMGLDPVHPKEKSTAEQVKPAHESVPLPPIAQLNPIAPTDRRLNLQKSPYYLQISQLQFYREGFADAHWGKVKEVLEDPSSNRPDVLKQDDYFSSYLSINSHSKTVQDSRRHLQNLINAFSSFPAFDAFGLPAETEEQKRDRPNAEVELRMYQKLGFWLCSYFLGVPQINVWEEVALLAGRLGAFPGGAFYDKMAGDIYRFERRQYAKGLSSDREIVYVMAYTPLLLISDEDDLNYTQEKQSLIHPTHLSFMEEVERLACRYLRFQAWRFFHDHSSPKIDYAVSQVSLVTALRDLADKRYLKARFGLGTPKYLEALELWSRQERTGTDVMPIAERADPAWWHEFTKIQKESEQRLALFVRPGRVNCRVAVFPDTATKRRGLTSCILGREGGVITNRPNRTDEATAFCTWTEGIVLKEERHKLVNLWSNSSKDRYEYIPNQDYVSRWCTGDVLKHCNILPERETVKP
jgi:hypothetical protein